MNRYLCQSILGSALVITLLVVGPIRASDVETETDYTDEACIECHRTGSEESDRHINLDEYQASVHSQELTCQDCHTGVVDDTHQSEVGAGAVDCGDCHEQENRHGPVEARIQCNDCHTRHNIRSKSDPASTVHVEQLPTTCAGCHPVASGETDFFSWFPSYQIASHNKGDFTTAYNKENCLGCHQGAAAHGESSPIDEQNCYKCHLSPDKAGAMWGYMHPKPDVKTQPTVFAAASIYQVFFALGLIVLLGKFLDLVFDRFYGKSK